MIAVDTNILVYAHRVDSPFHEEALTLINGLAESQSSWSIPWPCLHEFFAIVTHQRIYSPPSPITVAAEAIDAWLKAPNLVLLAEADSHWDHLSQLIKTRKISGPQIHDAKIAAICLSHRVSSLWTADRDFSRFPELKCHNPLHQTTKIRRT